MITPSTFSERIGRNCESFHNLFDVFSTSKAEDFTAALDASHVSRLLVAMARLPPENQEPYLVRFLLKGENITEGQTFTVKVQPEWSPHAAAQFKVRSSVARPLCICALYLYYPTYITLWDIPSLYPLYILSSIPSVYRLSISSIYLL